MSEVAGGKFANGAITSAFAFGRTISGSGRDSKDPWSYSDEELQAFVDAGPQYVGEPVPVPGVIGWKTGEYTTTVDSDVLQRQGNVITGVALIGSAAIAVDAGGPYAAAGLGMALRKGRDTWRNLSFDGPDKGARYANGRLFGIRWKQSQWGVRLDIHPYKGDPTNTPILHINYGPLGRGEAAYLTLFDPRWLGGGK